jgi:hypothetical protein
MAPSKKPSITIYPGTGIPLAEVWAEVSGSVSGTAINLKNLHYLSRKGRQEKFNIIKPLQEFFYRQQPTFLLGQIFSFDAFLQLSKTYQIFSRRILKKT